MKRTILLLLLVAGTALSAKVSAQGLNKVRINEVLVKNEANIIDAYGQHSSWIELFNSSYELVDIGGCHIGVTLADGSEIMYNIPSNDPDTQLHKQTYALFFCEGTGTKGTFYTNFTLDGVTRIAFYNQGKNLIDELTIDPAAQQADVSVGWMSPDGTSESQFMTLPRATPKSTNETIETVPRHELFRQRDSSGFVMAIIAMSVVFLALVLIFFVLKAFSMIMIRIHNRKENQETAAPDTTLTAAPAKRKSAGAQVEEEMAAVALALKMYQEEQHIAESTVITINRASRVYSPWSSKIHGIPPMPAR
jgi:Na+-transporting methylmalonyl-CoA/oxaloacetate decarboxylase gamma subunit